MNRAGRPGGAHYGGIRARKGKVSIKEGLQNYNALGPLSTREVIMLAGWNKTAVDRYLANIYGMQGRIVARAEFERMRKEMGI